MLTLDHLEPNSRIIALQEEKERIYFIDSRIWIPYPLSTKILEQFTELLSRPKVERMPNILLSGDTNNGKTELLLEFDRRYEAYLIPNVGTKLDVLMIKAPPKADEGRLYTNILKKLNVPSNLTEKVHKKYYQVEEALASLEVKILIIDEIHNVITGTYNKQREFLTVLKHLANELKICLIVAGTQDARRVINTDDQLANRFQPIELPRWKLNKEFLQLLVSFESKIPLRIPSKLAEKEIAMKIFDMSEGLLGEVSTIIKDSAKLAIRSGEEYISLKTIGSIDFTLPSQRRKK